VGPRLFHVGRSVVDWPPDVDKMLMGKVSE